LTLVEKMHTRNFPLPNVNDRSYIIQEALVHNGELHGACFARITSELILVLDDSLTNYSKATLFKEASEVLLKGLLDRGIKSTHLFITPEDDEHHVEVLAKHFGFVRATGIPLYWEVK